MSGLPPRRLAVTVGLTLLALISVAAAQEAQWPQFRGLAAGAVADDPALPNTWGETENVVWKAHIPGLGWSSPVVWDDQIFLTSAISATEQRPPRPGLYDPGRDFGSQRATAEHRWMVYAVDFETGELRWERELHRGVPSIMRHLKNSFASETPVTDGERLYVYFGSIGLVAALTLEGRRSGARSSARSTDGSGSAPRRRRSCTRTASTSSTTTRRGRSSPHSTRRRGMRSGGSSATRLRTGPRPWSGRTTFAPRS